MTRGYVQPVRLIGAMFSAEGPGRQAPKGGGKAPGFERRMSCSVIDALGVLRGKAPQSTPKCDWFRVQTNQRSRHVL